MDDVGRAGAGTAPPPVARSSRRPAAVLVGVFLTLAVGYVVLTGGSGSTAPGAELEGRWSGTGTPATCDGVVCPPGEAIDLLVGLHRVGAGRAGGARGGR